MSALRVGDGVDTGATPWCADCEWNLDTYDPGRRTPEFGWGRVDRRTHRIAARLNRRQYADLVGRPLESTGPDWRTSSTATYAACWSPSPR
ncbi:hypothetical protein AB0B63_03620 [Micromonospora sp. NPDC049081]|uniref:hypothetical protein n=1 Tax=Micromonospora sp. NPDC049081 TaxID=3155150 RepID=UPI0033FD385C